MPDREGLEEIKLEAEYWKQTLTLLNDGMKVLEKMNELIPSCVDKPRNLLKVQVQLLEVLNKNMEAVDIIRGRATYLERYVDEHLR